CRKGSRNYQKQKRKVARCHEKIRNQRKDYHHKLSFRLAEEYDAVAVEDLDLKAMSRNLNFGKSVMDNGYGNFLNILSYKLEQRGKVLVKTDRFYPSSKKCSKCGKVKETLALSERTYHCSCGNHMDRDVNAAINIREEGKRLLCA
ncbi:MAG TPA: transposase, partial [Candidatus Mediterraneibacter intestinigallinarum]|nr:transposase [Candidatus Mediterraneibacter intestinigallinarum]